MTTSGAATTSTTTTTSSNTGDLKIESQNTVSGLATSFPKVMFVEAFSGVRCVNVPGAMSYIAGIDSANAGKVIEIAMYSKLDAPLSDSFIGSKSSYKCSDADYLRNLLGPSSLGNVPQLCLNRKLLVPKDGIGMYLWDFQSQFANQLSSDQTSPANISFISKSYDLATGTISGQIQVQYGSSISDTDYLSVAIKENNLVDLQEAPGNGGLSKVDSYYVHNNVLRKYIYPEQGIKLPGATAGKTFVVSFTTKIPANWNSNNLMIVGILHKQNSVTGNYYVSQVAQTKIK